MLGRCVRLGHIEKAWGGIDVVVGARNLEDEDNTNSDLIEEYPYSGNNLYRCSAWSRVGDISILGDLRAMPVPLSIKQRADME